MELPSKKWYECFVELRASDFCSLFWMWKGIMKWEDECEWKNVDSLRRECSKDINDEYVKGERESVFDEEERRKIHNSVQVEEILLLSLWNTFSSSHFGKAFTPLDALYHFHCEKVETIN